MKIVMFCLGAFMVICAAIGWCCARVGATCDPDYDIRD